MALEAMPRAREDFPTLLAGQPRAKGCDVVYYGYDGRRTGAVISASLLYKFLTTLAARPASIINPTLPDGVPKRPGGFRYRRIVLVGHSLGAVVCRQAILFGVQSGKRWLDKTRFVAFAPAHMGSNVVVMASFILGMFKPLTPGTVVSLAKAFFPVLSDLEVGSSTLQQLHAQTMAAIPTTVRAGALHPLIARKAVFGSRDHIVESTPFAMNPAPTILLGRRHTDVCKPSKAFLDPLKIVARWI
jgi:hypothetical protein